MRALLIALVFLTRIPIPFRGVPHERDIGRSQLFYPLVGLLLGGVLVGVFFLLGGREPLLVAAILLAVWVLMTGGLHLDGLADSADAWAGGLGDRERTLAIMKDPACGPSGVVFLILTLLIKWAALVVLVEWQLWEALLIAPVLGRAAVPLLFLTTPYVRPGGLGSALAEHMPRLELMAMLAVLALVLLLFASWPMVVAAVVGCLLLRWLMLRRIGGTTGDTAGATIELVEMIVLLTAALLI
ncbi:adenosylcobinamide-GDP ribazoletransferase [Alkalilimnicola ehrlichii]|uniref:Adenosylcobinamide-GDP ribazoletransferase n=1 Tax=Alkalilimnicola ehrlichii TaxID=351052 RepID=A0A3E0WNF9_9GAMM|nr:adenosylcobinamide-GDP ribazoletransferase [Alkalilimnicola ehrlichii]RFA26844.1 adenosylcobinamide-GDP ribazoletransferase [Alkalilimnicola ehrlichii]RFA33939.1 adenosylcobinamide-GDP ribazoletransferase [Alkalilimnicola ehrlichii]